MNAKSASLMLFFWITFSLCPAVQINDELLTGEAFVPAGAGNDEISAAKNRALADLMNQIRVTVKSEFINEITETAQSLNEYTHMKVDAMSEMQLEGVRFDVIDQGDEKIVRAVLNKAETAELYQEKTRRLNEQLREQMDQALRLANNGRNEKALLATMEASKLFNEIEQNIIIYMVLGGKSLSAVRPGISRARIDSVTYLISDQNLKSFDDYITSLCHQVSGQIPENKKISIFPLSYETTSFFSKFSEYTRQKIESGLAKFLSFQAVAGGNPDGKEGYRITGSYWLKGDGTEIISILYDGMGRNIGSARVIIPQKLVDALQIPTKPQNFVDAFAEDKYFAKDEVIYGDLKIDFWTNKGDKNLIFHEGDEMRLYVRVNTPCYIRFIYHLANGMRVPLYESYYINEFSVNKVIELPDKFECAPPFGVEKLQLIASAEELPPLRKKTEMVEGEEYEVLSEDIQDFLGSTRGFIKKKSTATRMAERVLTITTMGK